MFKKIKKLFNKPIYLDAYTYRQGVYENAPIEKTSKFIPSWLKNMDPTPIFNEEEMYYEVNIKRCPGVNGLNSTGFTIPMWTDGVFDIGPANEKGSFHRWNFSDDLTQAVDHSPSQSKGKLDNGRYAHIKINSPWLLECSEDISFVWLNNPWVQEEIEYSKIPPAMTEYYYQHGTNINFLYERTDERKFVNIEFGTPLVQIVPLTERRVVLRVHLISMEDWENKNEYGSSLFWSSRYQKAKSNLIKKKKSKSNKCPFFKNRI